MASLDEVANLEAQAGLHTLDIYLQFAGMATKCKRELLKFLIAVKERGQTIVGYGAPAKGNTLLNYCGVRQDLLNYTVDLSPYKQGRYLPGVHIPIHGPDEIYATKPDYILILPWNLSTEITRQLASAREWGCQFVIPIPEVKILA